jgi:AhpD family alkylhydroperoxidase
MKCPVSQDAAGLSEILSEVAITYQRFTGECFKVGELDARTKQLNGLGVALFANNEVCTFFHVQEARALGVSDLQIMETVAVVSAAASGHVISQGVMRVQGALKNNVLDTEFAEEIDAPGMDIPGGIAVSPSY